jgi:hypothetical protein
MEKRDISKVRKTVSFLHADFVLDAAVEPEVVCRLYSIVMMMRRRRGLTYLTTSS